MQNPPDESRGSIGTPSDTVKPGTRSALLVSYYYPPSGGPGVQRVLKFSRYLPAFGYRPLILTVPEDAEFPVLDPSLAAEVPEQAVVARAPIIEFYSAYRRLTGKRGRSTTLDIDTVSQHRVGWRERTARLVRGALFIPDGRVGWLPGATAAGRELIQRHQPRVIFASGPPFTTHWIGRRLAEWSNLPLVVDYRDPWTRAPYYPERPGWARRVDERLEHSCLRAAAAVVTVNHTIRDHLLERYRDLDPAKFHQIANGFDPADFASLESRPARKWTLVHTGSLHGARIPHTLLEVLSAWLREDPGLADEMELRFVGRLDQGMIDALSIPPLDRIVRLDGYRPHGESVQALLDSHLLLLLIVDDPQSRGMLTGKLFEYLGSGRPILALAPEGEAAELLRRTGAGRVVLPRDAEGIRAALGEALAAHRRGEAAFGRPRAAEVAAYSRVELTGALARLFDRLGKDALSGPRAGD